VQPERRADWLRQLRDRCADPLQGLARGSGHLRRSGRRIHGIQGLVETGEEPPFEVAPPRLVDGEVADHTPDIGRRADFVRRRRGGQAQHHVLHHVFRLLAARENAIGDRDIGRVMPPGRRQSLGCRLRRRIGSAGRERRPSWVLVSVQ
jgi:hypothetical protein